MAVAIGPARARWVHENASYCGLRPLAPRDPHHQRKYKAQQQTCGQRKVKRQILPLYPDVPGAAGPRGISITRTPTHQDHPCCNQHPARAHRVRYPRDAYPPERSRAFASRSSRIVLSSIPSSVICTPDHGTANQVALAVTESRSGERTLTGGILAEMSIQFEKFGSISVGRQRESRDDSARRVRLIT